LCRSGRRRAGLDRYCEALLFLKLRIEGRRLLLLRQRPCNGLEGQGYADE
jgi:hypothetical protein